MLNRLLIIFGLLVGVLEAGYEKVKVGVIDRYYQDRVDSKELFFIIQQIKEQFDAQLGFATFEYSEDGKPIDILYVKPSQKKRQLQNAILKLESQQQQLKEYETQLQKDSNLIQEQKSILEQDSQELNTDVSTLNRYVNSINSKKNLSRDEYEELFLEINL